MFKSILLPTDGSELCEKAIRQGIALAKLTGAKIVGLTVAQPLHTGTPRALIPDHLLKAIHDEHAKECAAKLAVVEREAKAAGLAVETLWMTKDRPWEAIVQTATDKGCDLIVMASHARSGVSAMVLGSVTQKTLTHTTVPVLVVR
jgi:nucleotide-binding universal stress UspA family protein